MSYMPYFQKAEDSALPKTQQKRPSLWRPYLSMMKPTISALVLFTTIPGILLSDRQPSLIMFLATCLGTLLAAGSAGIFNHLVDAKIDQLMIRTKLRPLPAGTVSRKIAIFIGSIGAVTGFITLYIFASPLAAWIALSANAFYVLGYSLYLKPRTPQNIVIGGAAGAVGPLIGLAAVQQTIDLTGFLLFLIIFLWTPPHFWALALKYKKDYAKANIPMFPVVYGDNKTRLWILIYSLTLLPVVSTVYVLNPSLIAFSITSIPATCYFIWLAFELYREKSNSKAMSLFYYSCIYLFIVFTGMTIDRIIYFF